MISKDKCRALLEDDTISDEELEALRDALYESAEIAFDIYWKRQQSGSKNPIGLLPPPHDKDIP